MIYLLSLLYSLSINTLYLEIEGKETNKGTYHIALYDENNKFPDVKDTYKSLIVSAKSNKIKIDNIPAGNYAVAVFHDENGNGKLDKSTFGIPTEKYGFSNEARGVFSAPSFSEAKFKFTMDRKIVVKIK